MTQRFSGRLGLAISAICRACSDAKSRSISAENPTNEKGKGRHGGRPEAGAIPRPPAAEVLGRGQGWKMSPSINASRPARSASARPTSMGRERIQQIFTAGERSLARSHSAHPLGRPGSSVSGRPPVGDFFACGWGRYAQVSSLAVCVNPGRALNCYWEMPFRSRARFTLENRDPDSDAIIYWQINYTLTEVPEDAAYFHARFRRTNPLPFKQDYVVLDGVRGTRSL